MLYTHERQDVDVTIDHEQLRWLEADLGQTSSPTVVFMHHSAADQDLKLNRWFSSAEHLGLLPPDQRRQLRSLFCQDRRVLAVFNGHLHWNHLDVIDQIPYVTLQSLTENIWEDEPGQAAESYALVRLWPHRLLVEVAGLQPASYQFEFGVRR